MGLVPVWSIYMTIRMGRNITFLKNPYINIWIIIWSIIAGFRYIAPGIGGPDALNYEIFFENCFTAKSFGGSVAQYYDNIGFRYYNQLISLIFNNTRFYIILTYLIMAVLVAYIVTSLKIPKISAIPFFLLAFWYIRGFSSLRSNFAILIFLLSLLFFYKKKYIGGSILSLFSVLFHPMVALYLPCIPIYLIIKNSIQIEFKREILALIILILLSSTIFTFVFQNVSIFGDYSEHYEGYLSMRENDHTGFWSNYWKIAFEQLVLYFFMFLNRRTLRNYRKSLSLSFRHKFDFIWYLCNFDIIMIPICFLLNVWRGYEIFYIPRLAMWGIIIGLNYKKISIRAFKNIYFIVVFAIFIGWFIQRITASSFWYETSLMPYMFDL